MSIRDECFTNIIKNFTDPGESCTYVLSNIYRHKSLFYVVYKVTFKSYFHKRILKFISSAMLHGSAVVVV